MKFADWFRCWRGEPKYLPRSERQGQDWIQQKLIPLQAQIAVYFGDPDGSLESLQQGVMMLAKGETIFCIDCGRDIWKEKHRSDCDIAIQYKKVMSEPATPKYTTPKKLD